MGAREVLVKSRAEILSWPGVIRVSVGSDHGSECIFIIVEKMTPELRANIAAKGKQIDGTPIVLDEAFKVNRINPCKAVLDEYGSIDEARLDPSLLEKIRERYGYNDIMKIIELSEPSPASRISYDPLTGDMIAYPHELDRWGEYVSLGPPFFDAPTVEDPVQGYLSDCGLISSLAALAWVSPSSISKAMMQGDPCHITIDFYPENDDEPVSVTIDDRVLCKGGTDAESRPSPVFAHSFSNNDIWPGLFEKAYVSFRTKDPTGMPKGEQYSNIARLKDVNTYLIELTGWMELRMRDSDIWGFLRDNCQSDEDLGFKPKEDVLRRAKNVLIASTMDDSVTPKAEFDNRGLITEHAFSLLGFTDGGLILLRDPYGLRYSEPLIESQPDRAFYYYDDGGSGRGVIRPKVADAMFFISLDDFRRFFRGICGVKMGASRLNVAAMPV